MYISDGNVLYFMDNKGVSKVYQLMIGKSLDMTQDCKQIPNVSENWPKILIARF